MYDARGAMRQVIFKKTVYLNSYNKILKGDPVTITIIEEEVVKETTEIRTEER